jgi:Sortase domain
MIEAARRSPAGLRLMVSALVVLTACTAHSAAEPAPGRPSIAASPAATAPLITLDPTKVRTHAETTSEPRTAEPSTAVRATAAVATTAAPTTTVAPTAAWATTTAPTTAAPTTAAATPAAATTAAPTSAEPVAPEPTPSTTAAPPPVPVRSGANVNAIGDVGDPISISIPSIGVESLLIPTGALPDGTMAVPKDASTAGWFSGGPRPGETGPAVIMGHLDQKKTGPGVFWHLRDLQIGAEVIIHTTTGDVTFVATEEVLIPKDQFPTERVYGPVPTPALRLVTCGGSFDRSIGHYRSNVVVYLVPGTSP